MATSFRGQVTSITGEPPSTGFVIVGIGGQPVYYDINMSAGFKGTATVCIEYDDAGMSPGQEAALKLRKFDPKLDITQSVDTANNIICGKTTSFSILLSKRHCHRPSAVSRWIRTLASSAGVA